MRKTFIAAVSLVTGLVTFYAAAAGPAAAEPARESSASAYGLSASGLVEIAPTVTTQAAYPPGGDNALEGNFGSPSPAVLTLPVGDLAVAGVVGGAANAHLADDIVPTTSGVPDDTEAPDLGTPVTLQPVNTRALAKTTGLGVLFSPPPPGTVDPIADALSKLPSLVSADAVTSEAVAKCVDGQPVFSTGHEIVGLGGIVGETLDPVVQALVDTILALLSGDPLNPAPLSAVIAISPGVVTPLADGVAIDGLRISLFGGQTPGTELLEGGVLDLVVSHSEVHMAADCTVVAPPTTGPPAGPGGGRLASTGTDTPYLAIGAGMVALALMGGGIVRRSRKAAVQ